MATVNTDKCVEKIDPKLYCCRICLDTRYSKGINLVKSSHILELLEYCVGFTVDLQNTSHVLCVKCNNIIEEFEKFKRKCVKTESFWKKFPIPDNLICKTDLVLEQGNDLIVKTLIKVEPTDIDQEYEEPHSGLLHTEEDIEDFDEKSCPEIKKINHSALVDDKLKTCSDSNDEGVHFNVKCDDETKTFECRKCNKIYNNYKWLLKHLSNKRGCKEYLNKNKLSSNENVPTKECGLCEAIFSCDLNEHLKHHWINNHLQCQLCNYCGKDFAHMVTHRYSHYPNMKLHCIACDKKIVSMLSLQFHFRSQHLQKPGGYCTSCDKTFNIFKTWKRHHRMHTESNQLYVCDECGKKFLYRHEIETHMTYHTDSRQYVCETCGRGFKRISSLKEHIYNIHRVREPVKCGHCNKMYKCEKKLKIHLRNISLEKLFICEVCSRKFYTEKILKNHMFWHTGVRPFGCEVCGSKYKAKAQLAVHMRKHSGTLPYTCGNCGKSFASNNQLKRHKSVHTGIRAQKCMHCERSFHTKKLLLEHAMQHNNGGVKMES